MSEGRWPSMDARFWGKVSRVESELGGCWEWLGARDSGGYGRFWDRRRAAKAARWAYERFIGPIPAGLHLDHLCRNRACVNPAHLEPVTNRENVLRGTGHTARNARKTHCIHGHPLSGDNLYRHGLEKLGVRWCVTCRDITSKNRATKGGKE